MTALVIFIQANKENCGLRVTKYLLICSIIVKNTLRQTRQNKNTGINALCYRGQSWPHIIMAPRQMLTD